jgi:hypothetical protein
MTETHITLRIPRLRHVVRSLTGAHRRDAERQALIQQALAQGFAAGVAFMRQGQPVDDFAHDGYAHGKPEPVDPVQHELTHVVASAAGRAAVGVFFLALVTPSLLLAATAQLWAF